MEVTSNSPAPLSSIFFANSIASIFVLFLPPWVKTSHLLPFFFASIATTMHCDPNFFELSIIISGFLTAAVQNPDIIIESSKKFGSQCIVVAIDAKKNGDKWEVFTHGGRNNTGIDAVEFAKKMEDCGAGELLITSMDRDGTQVGYDIDLMSNISLKVNIPVIASGGVGNLDHLADGIKLGNASAVLAASIFHYGKHSVKEAKEYLDSKGIPVRI